MIKVTIKDQKEFDLVKSIVKDDFDLTGMICEDEEYLFPITLKFQYSEDFIDVKSTELCRLARMENTKETRLSKLVEAGIRSEYVDLKNYIYNLNSKDYQLLK